MAQVRPPVFKPKPYSFTTLKHLLAYMFGPYGSSDQVAKANGHCRSKKSDYSLVLLAITVTISSCLVPISAAT